MHSKYINSIIFDNIQDFENAIIRLKIKVAVVILNDFSTKLSKNQTEDLLVASGFKSINQYTIEKRMIYEKTI